MATSDVAICNLALGHLGDRANVTAISPPDGSYQAQQCAAFYPIARDELLEAYAWSFAKTRVQLAQLVLTPPGQWGFAYAYPNNCLRMLSVQILGQLDDESSVPYIVEKDPAGPNRVIYCNVSEAYARYIASDASVQHFSASFVTALSWYLASFLAGPITKSPKIQEKTMKAFFTAYLFATSRDANGEQTEAFPNHTPKWISERS